MKHVMRVAVGLSVLIAVCGLIFAVTTIIGIVFSLGPTPFATLVTLFVCAVAYGIGYCFVNS